MGAHPPVLSVVDYDAWGRGYLPPSEHILIDKLSYRGARVLCSASTSGDNEWWFVVKGELTPAARRAASKTLHMQMEFLDEVEPRPVTGFFALLTPEQLEAAMAYTGADNHPALTNQPAQAGDAAQVERAGSRDEPSPTQQEGS